MEADAWASLRLQQLQAELLALARHPPHERRLRLRALQLELHPDKQPQDRRAQAQQLFLRVQKEWENDAPPQHSAEAPITETDAEQRARIQREAMATVRSRQRDLQRQLEEKMRRAEAEELAAAQAARCSESVGPPQRGGVIDVEPHPAKHDYDYESNLGKEKNCATNQEAQRTHETESTEANELAIACRSIGRLLKSNLVGDVSQALQEIATCRQERRLEKPDKDALDWYEAESWRQYAGHQAMAGRYQQAIEGCLEKAINLDRGRGDLYLHRARYRMQMSCPCLEHEGWLPLDGSVAEAKKIASDCETALSCDCTLVHAYSLGVQVLIALGDLPAAEKLAKRGEATVADPALAMHLQQERRYARNLCRGFAEVEALLAADQKQPEKTKWLVESLRAMARPSIAPKLHERIESFHQLAEAQRTA